MTAINTHTIERLAATKTIDFTTIGRRSGEPARIEIWWFRVEDRFIISGTPGVRDWVANVLDNPSVVVHTDDGDFPGTAQVVDDREFRRRFFLHVDVSWYRTQADLDKLVETAPMIEITLT